MGCIIISLSKICNGGFSRVCMLACLVVLITRTSFIFSSSFTGWGTTFICLFYWVVVQVGDMSLSIFTTTGINVTMGCTMPGLSCISPCWVSSKWNIIMLYNEIYVREVGIINNNIDTITL